MKIVIPGGTGQVGTVLARAFHAAGDDVVVLARTPRSVAGRFVRWDAHDLDGRAAELDGADVVINLVGRSVNCRYTRANRDEILSSRVESVRAVGAAIARARRPPAVWLQASTATIHAHRFDAANDEATGIIGGAEPDAPASWRFSIEVPGPGGERWPRPSRRAHSGVDAPGRRAIEDCAERAYDVARVRARPANASDDRRSP